MYAMMLTLRGLAVAKVAGLEVPLCENVVLIHQNS